MKDQKINPIFTDLVNKILGCTVPFNTISQDQYSNYFLGQYQSEEEAVQALSKDLFDVPESVREYLDYKKIMGQFKKDHLVIKITLEGHLDARHSGSDYYLVFSRPKRGIASLLED